MATLDSLARRHLPPIGDGATWEGLIRSGAFGRLVAHARHLGLVDRSGFWLEDLAQAVMGRFLSPTEERRGDVDDFVACCQRQIEAGTFRFTWQPERVGVGDDVLEACWLMGHLLKEGNRKRLSAFGASEIGRWLEEVVRCQMMTGRLNYTHEVMAGWCGWIEGDGSNRSAAAQRMRRLHLRLVRGLDDDELVAPLLEVTAVYRRPGNATEGTGYTYRGLWDSWEDPIPTVIAAAPPPLETESAGAWDSGDPFALTRRAWAEWARDVLPLEMRAALSR